MLNDASLSLEDVDLVEPGNEATARLHPFAPQYWMHIVPGTVIRAHEGPRVIGIATVLEVVPPEQ
jgi:hypothetical protein